VRDRRPGPVLRRLLRAPAMLDRWRLGWLLGRRFLVLTHVGRRSGRRHRTVLEVIGADPATGEVMVMAGFGRSSEWYRNLRAQEAAEVVVGRRRFRPLHRVLDEQAAASVLAEYERRNRWLLPVVHRVLSALVGWRYDGSEDARRRLVRELPIVAFRPATAHEGAARISRR
jgi:deazaflavin-dependent oxidoreductase (nitroreductase family)